jgi:molecular chaperone DnaJ
MDYEVPISDAVLGAKHTLSMLDDSKIDIKIPLGTTHGTTLRISGKGIVTGQSKGNLLVNIKIRIPKKLSKKANTAMEFLQTEGY